VDYYRWTANSVRAYISKIINFKYTNVATIAKSLFGQ
jgi:hypothetical protein